MRKNNLIFGLIITCISINYAKATDNDEMYINDGIVEYYCDVKNSNFYFNANAIKPSLINIDKQKVNINDLLITSKEDANGNILRLGSKKEVRKCGDIKLVFESGFYNSNPLGMLGLIDYPMLSVSIKNKQVINRKTLNLCSSGGQRQECPNEPSIQSLEIIKRSKNVYRATLVNAIPQKNDSIKLERKIFTINK